MNRESNVFDRAREIVDKEYNRITVRSNRKGYEAARIAMGNLLPKTSEQITNLKVK